MKKSLSILAVIGAIIVGALTLLGTAFGIGLILSFPTKWLWNWLMPTLFGLKTINVYQAWGLSFLSSILFKSSK